MTRSTTILTATLAALIAVVLLFTPALAQITNPGVTGALGNNSAGAASGATFVSYFVTLWRAVIVIGGLIVLFYFIWGAIEWITAGGDSGKVDKARNRLTQSVIGLIILVASFTIIGFINQLFFGGSFNILNPVIPTPTNVNTNTGSGSTIRGINPGTSGATGTGTGGSPINPGAAGRN